MDTKWWQKAVFYEIYCKSFCDSDGDGIGDLKGVLSKLPVLKELGIDCIWFTPIYKSPQVDNGYDVADYQDIDPAYGTLNDFKEVLDKAHSMGIKVIMDMVLNHSSDEHYWFKESRKSKDNPYRNYYIWQPPKPDGSEPNNWGNYFREGNGSAWEYDETTGEYYFHQYSKKMPDLNWEYEPLRRDVYKMLNWWLDFGIDGFRLDVIPRLKKPAGFPDSKATPDPKLDRNGFVLDRSICTSIEGIHDIIKELNKEVFSRPDCMTVGEGTGVTAKNALDYVQADRNELDMIYHFEIALRRMPPFTADKFRKVQTEWKDVIDKNGWGVQYFSNHDSQRQVSQQGNDKEYRVESAKLLAVLLLTTPGTPFMYQGEEIGMVNVKFNDIKDYNCCYTVGDYYSLIENGSTHEEAIDFVAQRSRDNARTPYQWNAKDNAGFTTGTPWMKVNPNYKHLNLEADKNSPDSVFNFYKNLLSFRKEHPVIVYGSLEFLFDSDPNIISYIREDEKEKILVLTNRSDGNSKFVVPSSISNTKWKRVICNTENTTPSINGRCELLPWETEIYVSVK